MRGAGPAIEAAIRAHLIAGILALAISVVRRETLKVLNKIQTNRTLSFRTKTKLIDIILICNGKRGKQR